MHKTLNHPEKGRWRGRYSFLVQLHLLSCLPGLCAALPLFCGWLGHGTLQGIEAVAVRGALVNSSGVFPGLVWHCEPLFWLPVPAGELRSLCREPGLPTSPSVVRPRFGEGGPLPPRTVFTLGSRFLGRRGPDVRLQQGDVRLSACAAAGTQHPPG